MSEATSTSQTSPQSQTLSEIIGRLAWVLSNQATPGDVAALRRLKHGDPLCLAFWKLAAAHLDSSLPAGAAQLEEAENRWGVVLSAMAELEGLHRPQLRLGRVLAESAYSEPRLLRLLRAHGAALADSIRTLAHFLRSKGVAANQMDIALLVLSEGRRDEEAVRRRIARDYYSAQTRS